MQVVRSFVAGIVRLWSKGCIGKAVVLLGGLIVLGLCGSIVGGGNRTRTAATPTAPAQAVIAAPGATEAPAATNAPRATQTPKPSATPEPTETLVPTFTPEPTLTVKPHNVKGVAPLSKNDCPPEYLIKGNIGNNGKLYHVPGSRSYAGTNPERCFATEADAEAAGFHAPANP
jgi:hypothetical protein